MYGALDDFAARHATGAGVFVGPPFGLKLGLFLAAHPRGKELLGVDGSGAAYRYEPALHPAAAQAEVRDDGGVAAYASRGPRELFWGSESLYPPGTFTPGMRPIAAVPDIESRESALWPELLPGVAAEVRVPFQFSVAEHEQWWQRRGPGRVSGTVHRGAAAGRATAARGRPQHQPGVGRAFLPSERAGLCRAVPAQLSSRRIRRCPRVMTSSRRAATPSAAISRRDDSARSASRASSVPRLPRRW